MEEAVQQALADNPDIKAVQNVLADQIVKKVLEYTNAVTDAANARAQGDEKGAQEAEARAIKASNAAEALGKITKRMGGDLPKALRHSVQKLTPEQLKAVAGFAERTGM